MCVEGTMRETLLNGDHENYNMDYGYTLHMISDSCSEGITGEHYMEWYVRNSFIYASNFNMFESMLVVYRVVPFLQHDFRELFILNIKFMVTNLPLFPH